MKKSLNTFKPLNDQELANVNGGIWPLVFNVLKAAATYVAGDAWQHSDQIRNGMKNRKKKGYGY